MIAVATQSAGARAVKPRERRSVGELLDRLPKVALSVGNLFAAPLAGFNRCGVDYRLPKYVFIGPPGGDAYQRVALFAGLHGDEVAGSIALVELLLDLHENPGLATGFELFVYPVCNPSGYEDATRWPRGGPDLNREFWCGSSQPEVALLEEQLAALRFDGIVSLHSDDTTDGIYGYVAGDVLTKYLLEPALAAGEKFLPRNRTGLIDGWPANDGIIEDCFSGVLSAPASQTPRPFEIVFETPQSADLDAQVAAHRAAVLAVLHAALRLRAHAANI
jgi:predicted deacylase